MYFPYLRGKRFELEALLNVPIRVFRNTIPIIEPIKLTWKNSFKKLADEDRGFILITNPQYGVLTQEQIQGTLIDDILANHESLILGFIVGPHSTYAELSAFLKANKSRNKAVIFRFKPEQAELERIVELIRTKGARYIIFDDSRTSTRVRAAFDWHDSRVLLTDGFQKQETNADYPTYSVFESNIRTYSTDGWAGMGDYLTVGDNYSESGGQPKVVTLHLTVRNGSTLRIYHFSSRTNADSQGAAGPKFLEACSSLVASPVVAPLRSTGLTDYRLWEVEEHFPTLGAAKRASMQHHIELMSGLI